MRPIRIGIIDYGSSSLAINSVVERQVLQSSKNDIIFDGQGVIKIISDFSINVELINFNVCYDGSDCFESSLICAISECIREKVDIINVSVGCSTCSAQLKSICESAVEQGIIVVAAKETFAPNVYPADLDNVICVLGNEDYQYGMWNIDSNLNVFACKNWELQIGAKTVAFSGSRFACAYITAVIANYILNNENSSLLMIAKHLIEYRGRVGYIEKLPNDKEIITADLYQLTWENLCILRHMDLLHNITISNVFVPRGRGLNNKKVNEMFPIDACDIKITEGLSNLAYSKSNSIILSGIIEGDGQEGVRLGEILNLCINNNKNIIFLDVLPEETRYWYAIQSVKSLLYIWTNVWNDKAEKSDVSTQANIIAIISTSGKSPAINLEARLLRSLRKRNLTFQYVASSPVAALWGEKPHNIAFYADTTMETRFEVAEKHRYNCDLSIIGIPHPVLKWNSTYQKHSDEIRGLEEILAVNPSSIVMGINASDPIEYIADTIKILEASLGIKPDLLVIGEETFDGETYIDNTLLFLPMTKKQKLERCRYIQKTINIPCCIGELDEDLLLEYIFQ